MRSVQRASPISISASGERSMREKSMGDRQGERAEGVGETLSASRAIRGDRAKVANRIAAINCLGMGLSLCEQALPSGEGPSARITLGGNVDGLMGNANYSPHHQHILNGKRHGAGIAFKSSCDVNKSSGACIQERLPQSGL